MRKLALVLVDLFNILVFAGVTTGIGCATFHMLPEPYNYSITFFVAIMGVIIYAQAGLINPLVTLRGRCFRIGDFVGFTHSKGPYEKKLLSHTKGVILNLEYRVPHDNYRGFFLNPDEQVRTATIDLGNKERAVVPCELVTDLHREYSSGSKIFNKG